MRTAVAVIVAGAGPDTLATISSTPLKAITVQTKSVEVGGSSNFDFYNCRAKTSFGSPLEDTHCCLHHSTDAVAFVDS